MKKKCCFLCIILICFLTSCVSTKIEGFKKTEVNFYEYNNILVFCNFENLKYRKQLENEFYKEFNSKKIKSIKSIELISPLKSYSNEDVSNLIKEAGVEILMEIKILSINTNSGDSSSLFVPMGGFFFGGSDSETEVTIDFDITVYDVNKEEILFRGTATGEEEDDDFSDCIEEIFEDFAEEFIDMYFVPSL